MAWRPGRTAVGSRDVVAALRSALLAILDGDLDRAERELSEILRADSKDADVFLALARVSRRRGEIGRAIRIHQNLLLRADLDARQRRQSLLGLAEDFRQGGFRRRAVAAYEEVLAREPGEPEALRRVVELCAALGDFSRALRAARRRTAGAPGASQADLLVGLAAAERAEGRDGAARAALKRALRRDRRHVDALLLLGDLEAERGRSQAALAAWRRVPQIDRRRGIEVYEKLAATFAALGRARAYEDYLQQILANDPDDLEARTALGRALRERGAEAEAESELRRVLDRDPNQLAARVQLGRLLLSANREAPALKAFDELLAALEFPPRASAPQVRP